MIKSRDAIDSHFIEFRNLYEKYMFGANYYEYYVFCIINNLLYGSIDSIMDFVIFLEGFENKLKEDCIGLEREEGENEIDYYERMEKQSLEKEKIKEYILYCEQKECQSSKIENYFIFQKEKYA